MTQKFPLTDALAKRLESPTRREVLAEVLHVVHVMFSPDHTEIHVLATQRLTETMSKAALDLLDCSTINDRILDAAKSFTTSFGIPYEQAMYFKSPRAHPTVRNIESDLSVIMHCLFDGDRAELVLMGDSLNRKRAEFRIKGNVDYTRPGYFTGGRGDYSIDAEWGFVAPLDLPRFDGIRKSATLFPRRCQIGAASQCEIAVLDDRWLCMAGTQKSQDLALLLMEARESPQRVSLNRVENHEYSTSLIIPPDSVSGLYSHSGNELSEVMDSHGVVLVFVGGGRERPVHACIFSVNQQARFKAKFMLMDKVEGLAGRAGYYSRHLKDHKTLSPGVSTDTFRLLKSEEVFARKPVNVESLNRTSQCAIGFVGDVAHFGGDLDERKRGRRYMRWLLESRVGMPEVDATDPDLTVITEVPPTDDKQERALELQRESRAFVFVAHVSQKGPCYVLAHPQQAYRDRVIHDVRSIVKASPPPAKRRRSH